MAISRTALVHATWERLEIPNVTRYLIDVDPPPPLLDPANPNDPRVGHYIVLHPGGGAPTEDRNQADDVVEHDWTCQLNVVTGDQNKLAPLLDVVTGLMQGWQPLDRADCGRFDQIGDLGTGLKDKNQTPPRFWLPLIYRVAIGDPREPEAP